jgi:ketosteroid isomerase-like protein
MKADQASVEAFADARAQIGLARALSNGDLDSATACFAKDACLITPDGTAIYGRDGIRPVLAQLISRRVEIDVQFSNVVGGDGALLACERWRIRSGASGTRLSQITDPILVMRPVEGSWKIAVAAPWGWAGWAR